MPTETSLIHTLRTRIKDVRHSARAFGLSLTSDVTSALAEVTQGHFIVTVVGGGEASNIDFLLSDARYDTIGGLTQALSRMSGYSCNVDEDANLTHSSLDLREFGPIPLQGTGIELTHHTFSDEELEAILSDAIQRHNPSMTLMTLPPQEYAFVLPLAQAAICKIQAYDASKRKGLDATSETLMQLARSWEEQYAVDTHRNANALSSPREANSNLMGEGDIVLGKITRRSLRTGFESPLSQVLPPNPVVLKDPDEHDVEDDNIRLIWERNRNMDFYSYELWMDSTPDVVRHHEGSLTSAGPPYVEGYGYDNQRSNAHRRTTSVLIFKSFGANSPSYKSSVSTFVEELGQGVRSFAVSSLESNTTYYFRLYVFNANSLSSSSNVVRGTTKSLRTRFLPRSRPATQPGPVGGYTNKTMGPAGTIVTIDLDPIAGAYTVDNTFRVGEKEVVPTIITPYQVQIIIPTFQNIGPKTFSIESPNRLVDVRTQAFTVTA